MKTEVGRNCRQVSFRNVLRTIKTNYSTVPYRNLNACEPKYIIGIYTFLRLIDDMLRTYEDSVSRTSRSRSFSAPWP
jgi:hypothetical protein